MTLNLEKQQNIIKIGQISDLHIGNGRELVQDIDVCGNFIQALDAIQKENLDLLVLSGDLADDKALAAYEFIAEEMKTYKGDWCFVPGNHDDLFYMNQVFGISKDIQNGEYFYKKMIKGRTLFFLDSSQDRISKDQLLWLKSEALQVKGEALLFVHHPPCYAGHVFMDSKYALQNIEETQFYLNPIENIRYVFCGHYHSELETFFGDKKVLISPSTQMTIEKDTPYFSLKSTKPAWCVIEWGIDFLNRRVIQGD